MIMRHRSILAMFGLALSAVAVRVPLAAQQAGPLTPAELAAPVAFDPLVTVDTLPNGLVYYIRENRYPEHRAELRLAVRVGSVVEEDDQRGLAHVTEHMAFNGTTSFPKNDLVHYLQSIGSRFGADVNAYTSFDETVYMLEVPTDTGKFLSTGIQILGEWAHGVTFDPTEIDAERGVVSEEWRLGRGAGARMRDQQFPVLLKDSRYADRMIIGTLEGLQGFPHEALTRFYRTWYRPDLMAVVAVGDFDKDSVEAMIRAQFGGIPRGTPQERPVYPIPAHDSAYVTVATDPEATNSSFTLYRILPQRSYATLQDFRSRYIEQLGLGMLAARFSEITQKPNPPFAFASASRGTFVGPADAFSLFGGVKEGAIVTGFTAALLEVERARRFGFTQGELTRELASQSASQERLYNDRDKQPSAARAAELLRHFLNHEEVLGTAGEYQAYQRINPTITLAEVNAAAQALYGAGSPVITANAPATAGAAVPTATELLTAYAAARSATLEPYRDSVVGSQLLATIPEPAAITAERQLPAIDATEWTLANGVRVVLKPTDFKNDEVVLTSTSPGGTSLYPDSDFPTANFADNVIGLGGVGTMSAVDLRKVLSGKNASASASISDNSESVSGRSSAKDIETMLQLVYLRFTAPREDSSAFLAFKQSMQAMLANSAASPQMAFSDTVSMTLTGGSPRVPVMRPDMFDQIDLDRAMAIYRDRFADASDFTFFIVGSFATDAIRPLVQRYLGGLPSIHRTEAPRDVGPVPPEGRIEKLVRKGTEPQSQTIMIFSAPFTWDAEENHVLSSLGEVLGNRLLDNLREKLGGTYSVNAMLQGNRDYPPMALGMVQFGSAPDRAGELEQAVLAEITALADSGPSAAELEKVREGQIRSRETALRTNAFWAGRLSQAYEYGDDPAEILAWRTLVDGLTAEKIRDAARRYLDGTNYAHFVLVPAEVVP
jgi:zinc protease